MIEIIKNAAAISYNSKQTSNSYSHILTHHNKTRKKHRTHIHTSSLITTKLKTNTGLIFTHENKRETGINPFLLTLLSDPCHSEGETERAA